MFEIALFICSSFAGEIPIRIERLVCAQSVSIAEGEAGLGGGHGTDHDTGKLDHNVESNRVESFRMNI